MMFLGIIMTLTAQTWYLAVVIQILTSSLLPCYWLTFHPNLKSDIVLAV